MRAGACNDRRAGLRVEIRTIKDPGSYRQRAFRLHLTTFDGEPQCASAHTDQMRRFCQVQPSFFRASLLRVDGDLVIASKRRDALLDPEVPSPGAKIVAIEHVG